MTHQVEMAASVLQLAEHGCMAWLGVWLEWLGKASLVHQPVQHLRHVPPAPPLHH